jgi:hypothetical protein
MSRQRKSCKMLLVLHRLAIWCKYMTDPHVGLTSLGRMYFLYADSFALAVAQALPLQCTS